MLTRIAAAVVIVLLLTVGGYFYFEKNSETQIIKTETPQERFKNDAVPGGNKALLTLSDGTEIILDSAENGTLTQQGNTKIIKLDDGQLAYNPSASTGEVLYNTISTPKGGQYQIILPDQSKVWLNAVSSLRFPASFPGDNRSVDLQGEAYFEIAKNKAKPFVINVNNLQVEVLGTHLNINAYADEPFTKTTLLEGSVQVKNSGSVKVLVPGQQAQVNSSPEVKVVNANIEETMAWKDGLFQFEHTDIKTIMRQVARWYDVEVIYKAEINEKFGGSIPRNVNASKLFQMLELTNHVHFQIEGKKVFVME